MKKVKKKVEPFSILLVNKSNLNSAEIILL